jgi:hypothetical protein
MDQGSGIMSDVGETSTRAKPYPTSGERECDCGPKYEHLINVNPD